MNICRRREYPTVGTHSDSSEKRLISVRNFQLTVCRDGKKLLILYQFCVTISMEEEMKERKLAVTPVIFLCVLII